MQARRTLRVALIVLIGLAGSRAASANVGARSTGGQLAGEPPGIRDVAILGETLVIDLRPLADDGRVQVVATYRLDNRAGELALDLVLASGSGQPDDLRVTLDGAAVITKARAGELPATWKAPATTPLPDGGDLDYVVREPRALEGFQLTLPPGRHELSMSYAADAVRHHAGEPTLMRQFAYVLAPARSWAGFGGLDATVRVPAGWSAAVRPEMTRDGDTLHATFPDLPADAIALTVQAPTLLFQLLRYAGGALLALALVGGGIVMWRRAAARQRELSAIGLAPSLRRALAPGAAWSAAFFAVGLAAVFIPDSVLGSQEDRRGYVEAAWTVLLLLGTLLLLPIYTAVAHRAARAAHAASPEPHMKLRRDPDPAARVDA
jgi:hypothetical protein